MQFSLAGINHQTAPVSIREKATIGIEKLEDGLSLLRAYIHQGIILSTCNRTEIYTVENDANDKKAGLEFLRDRVGSSGEYIYTDKNEKAMEHLLRVASGLESMAVGEYEVLGQVHSALQAAEKARMVSLALRYIFNAAVRTGRKVREETGISQNALSISAVAVGLAEEAVGDLKSCKMLVLGAGEAGKLVAKVAHERGVSQILIANRTLEKALALARTMNGVPIELKHLQDELSNINIIVTCAKAPHRLIRVDQIVEARKRNPALPLAIIDIGVPRNVEPEVGTINHVHLYNLDDLTEISNANRKERESSIRQAETILGDELKKLCSWWKDYDARPLISALMTKAEAIRSRQFNGTLKKLPPLSNEHRENLEAMTKAIVTRILQDPIKYLKSNGNSGQADLIKELFRLEIERPAKSKDPNARTMGKSESARQLFRERD
jgi:glutamyl-tRNA reductase